MRQMKAFGDGEAAADGYLFFDTETTGLSRESRLVQIAWIHCGPDGEEIGRESHIIRPEGFRIPSDAAAIHGITTEHALEVGVPLEDAMSRFQQALDRAEFVVGHNVSFDEMFIETETSRLGMMNRMPAKRLICTMQRSAEFCGIPSMSWQRKYKWPRLMELHQKLFGAEFDDAHDAGADVAATMRCFWELRRRGVL